MKSEMDTLDLTATANSNVKSIDIATLEKIEESEETVIEETVVELEDAIKNGKNAIPIDLEKTLEASEEVKQETKDADMPSFSKAATSPAESKDVPRQEQVPAKTSTKLIIKGTDHKVNIHFTKPTAKRSIPAKPKKSTVVKLPDIYSTQGPLVGRKYTDDTNPLLSVNSEKSLKTEAEGNKNNNYCLIMNDYWLMVW